MAQKYKKNSGFFLRETVILHHQPAYIIIRISAINVRLTK